MPPKLFTAEDIRRLARDQTQPLVLGPDDVLTQEAADTARALGLRVVHDLNIKTASLKVVHLANIQVEPFLEGKAAPGTNAWHKDVNITPDGSAVRTGYMSLDKGEMQRELSSDEIDIVLEGELIVTRGSERVRGKTGDVIHIPKGSSITFGTPNWTRFVYVVYPRNEK